MEIAVRHFRAAPPWRRIAIVVGIVAAVELVLLVVAGISLIAKPVQTSMKRAAVAQAHAAPLRQAPAHAVAAAKSSAGRAAAAPVAAATPALAAHLPRAKTAVLVLNGIGTPGAAGRTADRMRVRGYLIGGVTNATRMDYTRTTIMYRPGFAGEAARLGRDLKVPLVGPLDGMRTADLGAAQLVVIVGP